MSKCYIHSDKAAVRNCSSCGQSICRDCVFEEVVSSRVTRTVTTSNYHGSEVEHEYDFYCPECFISFAEKKGFDLGTRGVFFRFRKSPGKAALIALWGSLILGFVLNIFFPIGYLLLAGTVICMIVLWWMASKNYKKVLKAQQLIHFEPITEPAIISNESHEGHEEHAEHENPEETTNVCPSCGKDNPTGSKFCNHCGSLI